MPRPAPASAPPDRVLAAATVAALIVAGLLTAVWLWSKWCGFTSNPWNDIRMAPAIAASRGISIYTTAAAGPVSTWVYGPIPLLLFAPVGLASNALTAIQLAGALHLAFVAGALALVCFGWPAGSAVASVAARSAAWLVCMLLFRADSAGFGVFTADAPGLALALVSLVALVRQRYWIAAVAAVAAAGCKQILVAVPVAELLWLLLAASRRDALAHLGRCAVAGAILTGVAGACFGFAGLWHTAVELPGRFPWADTAARLHGQLGAFVALVVAPLAVIALRLRSWWTSRSTLLLPALLFLVAGPLGVASFFKTGGNLNSLGAFWLWFPPFLVTLVVAADVPAWRRYRAAGLALGAAALAAWSVLTEPLRLRPNDGAYREAMQLAAAHRDAIWFPMHPTVTLYSDGRFYHDYDGLLERVLAGETVGDERFFAHMPAQRKFVAILLPVGWGPADPVHARLKAGATPLQFGNWLLQPVDR